MKKAFQLKTLLLLLLIVALLLPLYSGVTALDNKQYGEDALTVLKKLETMGPRLAGSKQEVKTAEYIRDQFKAYGLKPTTVSFNYTLTNEKTKKPTKYKSSNVVATILGNSSKQVIIGAHYDSVKVGKGADDNASGVSVMLETAKGIASNKTKPNYTLVFVAFGAEEVDLQGSQAYVKRMTKSQIANTVVMINLDSLIAGDDMNVYGDFGKDGVYRDLALAFASSKKIPLTTNEGNNPEFPAGTTGDWSDHAPFKLAGIQHVYFESTNWNLGQMDGYTQVEEKFGVDGEIWHTKYDTLSYIEKTFPKRATSHLAAFVEVVEYLALYAPKQ